MRAWGRLLQNDAAVRCLVCGRHPFRAPSTARLLREKERCLSLVMVPVGLVGACVIAPGRAGGRRNHQELLLAYFHLRVGHRLNYNTTLKDNTAGSTRRKTKERDWVREPFFSFIMSPCFFSVFAFHIFFFLPSSPTTILTLSPPPSRSYYQPYFPCVCALLCMPLAFPSNKSASLSAACMARVLI